jgi:hypothetical protein
MSKKYLSLEEAASLLSIPKDELMRMRERGDVRGFADRGNWKFKQEDIETLGRSLQADSNPEVPLFADDDSDAGFPQTGPDSDLAISDDDSVGDQPTVIRRDSGADSDESILADEESGGRPQTGSDSDVRLVGGSDVDLDYPDDSDVKLVGMDSDSDVQLEGTSPEVPIREEDSDSDVKLSGDDSDSDVKLADQDSDSDVKLGTDSDSDVQLVGADDDSSSHEGDVRLVEDEEPVAIDLDEDDQQGSILEEESGVSLGGEDSSLLLGGESGISLEGPSDSGVSLGDDDDEGITLALDDDSGISLDSGDSGISLETGESGISLEPDDHEGTIPMIDALGDEEGVDETQYEIPSLEDEDDSGYELHAEGSDDETGVLDVVGEDDTSLDDAVFDVDEEEGFDSGDEFESEELDLEEDAFDDEEDLDVFDADEDVFEGDEEEGELAGSPLAGRMPVAEADWGTGTFVGLALSSLFLLLCGAVMIDLVKNTATAASPNPISGMMLDILGGLYK